MTEAKEDPRGQKAPYTAEFPGRMILTIPVFRGDEQIELSFQFDPGVMPSKSDIRELIDNVTRDISEGIVKPELAGFLPMSLVEFQQAINAVYAVDGKHFVNLGETQQ